MAHNIAVINGFSAMAYQGQTPWHDRGTRVPSMTNTADALVAAHLDWSVNLQPLYLGDGRKVDDRFATVRDIDNAVLGTVGPNYTVINNNDAAEVFNDVCRDYGVTIETLGALGNGERVWMLAKMHQTIEPIAGDRINGYMLSHWSHDGTTAHYVQLTPVRVVCQNTLNAALRGAKPFITTRHTASAADRLTEARRLITAMTKSLQETGKTYAELARTTLTREQLATFINTIVPQPDPQKQSNTVNERRDTIARLMRYGVGADMANQSVPTGQVSAWAAYNAITEYWDHVRPAETKSEGARVSATESAVFGAGAQSKREALALVSELANIETAQPVQQLQYA